MATAYTVNNPQDRKSATDFLALSAPIINPWWGLAGAGLGFLQHGQRQRDAARARKLNATLMATSPWTGMGPTQTDIPDPSLLGSIIGGVGTANSLIGNINQFSPAYNALRQKQEMAGATVGAEDAAALATEPPVEYEYVDVPDFGAHQMTYMTGFDPYVLPPEDPQQMQGSAWERLGDINADGQRRTSGMTPTPTMMRPEHVPGGQMRPFGSPYSMMRGGGY